MTVAQLISNLQNLLLHGLKEDDEVIAWDADAEEHLPVTGFSYGGNTGTITLETDDPS